MTRLSHKCFGGQGPLMNTAQSIAAEQAERPSIRTVTRDQWRAFWAVMLGWIVDSFDFNILAFIVIDIQQSFTIDRALAGAARHHHAR